MSPDNYAVYNDCISKYDGKTYKDFLVYLFEHKEYYNINCEDIAEVLNAYRGTNFDESVFRKYYKAFNDGRVYEREKLQYDGVNKRILCLSDLHVPFNLPVINVIEKYSGKVDVLVLNGDILDCYALSKFPKEYRMSVIEELVAARECICNIINSISPKEVYINYGNHDLRLQKYLVSKLDNDFSDLVPKTPLEYIINDGFTHYDKLHKAKTFYEPLAQIYKEINIVFTNDWKCKIGKTWFAHPSAFSSGILKTTERAMNYFNLNDWDKFDTVVVAHTHQLGFTKRGNIRLFEQGCLCDKSKIMYADGMLTNPQENGYLCICQDENGNIIDDKSKIEHF